MSCHQLNRCHNVYPSSLAHFSLFVCVHCILCVTVCVFVQTELTSQNSPNCMFKILPRYKVRSVGDEVSGTAHWLRLGCSNELHTSMGYRRTCKSYVVIVRTVCVPMQWYPATDTQWFCYCTLHVCICVVPWFLCITHDLSPVTSSRHVHPPPS